MGTQRLISRSSPYLYQYKLISSLEYIPFCSQDVGSATAHGHVTTASKSLLYAPGQHYEPPHQFRTSSRPSLRKIRISLFFASSALSKSKDSHRKIQTPNERESFYRFWSKEYREYQAYLRDGSQTARDSYSRAMKRRMKDRGGLSFAIHAAGLLVITVVLGASLCILYVARGFQGFLHRYLFLMYVIPVWLIWEVITWARSGKSEARGVYDGLSVMVHGRHVTLVILVAQTTLSSLRSL
jgi:hypothetical protein